ncbi:mitochondrial carrier domain-containing protein [Irpex rosettiformis]|uniref:Mitochondrial carrier domain-containing protein n=1 Tax=Irpex rosettiformis TaxID=378272 RepID=A0ACB8U9H4_9APHY|nr:mitochondrial carrier domain-containing protein [Irpex rosettiformis]
MVPHASSSKTQDKQSLHYIVRSGLAGGLAGCVAKTVVAPLDRVKILFQASNPDFHKYAGTWSGAFFAARQIYRENGILGLFQGHSATLLRIFPYAAIKFMAYDQIEHILMPTHEQETNLRRFTAGALSGMTSVLFTYPLEIVRVRMAFHTRSMDNGTFAGKPTFLRAASEIYHEAPKPPPQPTSSSSLSTLSPSTLSPPRTSSSSPLRASSAVIEAIPHTLSQTAPNIFTRFPILKFYRGFTVTLTGMVPYAGTSFLTWGFLRSRFLPSTSDHKSVPIIDLTAGAVSGALSQTVSYPFEVIRRRMQVGGLTHPDRWMHWSETVSTIWRSGGWKGFYVGLSIGYLKIVPMTAVSFTVWQWGKGFLGV